MKLVGGNTKTANVTVAVILTVMVGILFFQANHKVSSRTLPPEGANLIGVSTNCW